MLIVRDMEFSPKRPRVIVPLFARNLAALSAQTAAAEASPVAELAELRLDPLPREAYTDALCAVRAALHKPLIVTLRTAAEGGEAPFTADAYRDAWAVWIFWTSSGCLPPPTAPCCWQPRSKTMCG